MVRNIPILDPVALKGLVKVRENKIASKVLASNSGVVITMLSFSEGELVDAESYKGDTLYYIIEGKATFGFVSTDKVAKEGEIVNVPAETSHKVKCDEDMKMLQITVEKE